MCSPRLFETDSGPIDSVSTVEKAEDSNSGPNDRYGDRWRLAVIGLVAMPDLLELYVVPYHSEFQGYGCWFPFTPCIGL